MAKRINNNYGFDPLLRGAKFNFSVDSLGRIDETSYEALLIPDIESEFFPPFHTRSITVSKELLEYNFYHDQFPLEEKNANEFIGDLQQGGYYSVPSVEFSQKCKYPENKKIESAFLKKYLRPFPYEINQKGEQNYNTDDRSLDISDKNVKFNGSFLYCFNVGQGDSNLLITSSGNVYLIDTNIHFNYELDNFTEKIKKILKKHNLNENIIKGLIFTHLHLDHIRGADKLIDSKAFQFEYFIINQDYKHNTTVTKRLYESATVIPNWINSNKPWRFKEGNTLLCIKNPDHKTRISPDINNSSISLCINDHNNLIYLTGDTGMHILENCYKCKHLSTAKKSVLKVSHHGSRTGTSEEFIKLINPNFSFVSAGNHAKFRHPHHESLDILNNHGIDTDISKKILKDVVYISGSKGILREYYPF